MDEVKITKNDIRNAITEKLKALSEAEIVAKSTIIENKLFEFANFIESKIALLYVNRKNEVPTEQILKRSLNYNKILVLPAFNPDTSKMTPLKVDNLASDLKPGPKRVLEPDGGRCKIVPVEYLDIVIIPGWAFDEKGGRLGSGEGYYDRLIPKLSVTTRKVALAYECQLIPQVPMESHDKHVDILITEERIIYKI